MLVQVGRYQYPREERYELWYRCPQRSCTVYIEFPEGWNHEYEVRHALNAAIENDTCAIRVTPKRHASPETDKSQIRRPRDRLQFNTCEFKPYQPHFNSDYSAVDHDDLIDVKPLRHNVKLVSFRGELFIYKFMTLRCYQFTFETEVDNYRKLAGASGIPTLTAVVRKEGLIQGLLISYIEGPDLWSSVKNTEIPDDALLLDITYRIIRIAANLERLKFYHEDLKCSNIVRRHTDGELYFIDFGGGLTEGMYREDRVSSTSYDGPEAIDALFTLGRTLWELWAADSPWKGAPLDRVRNETVRDIIRDCEQGNVESIVRLSERYLSTSFGPPA